MALTMKQFPWLFSTMWLLILLVMISAGFWQLSRAEEKRAINARLAAGEVNKPQTTQDWQPLIAFDQVQVQGKFVNTHFLLDNQIMDERVGFFVFTTFKTFDGILLLINRGWSNDDQQNFDVLPGQHKLTALLADWPRPGIQLGEQIVNNQAIQHLTYLDQQLTTDILKQRHCQQNNVEDCIILPRVLKLAVDMDHGFKRHWQLPRMTVEKHRAYATQWFTMSLVLCIIYAVFLNKTYIKNNYASKN